MVEITIICSDCNKRLSTHLVASLYNQLYELEQEVIKEHKEKGECKHGK